ncbi:MAG TPA: nitrogen regulation protein NR(II) [Accumulibacter sp.]|uniref:nitrogen regulation protein NR(II) n=1 Tax=Accumulibacter sp. TaxID=2053492 RepID=UPI002605D641|nr:nitrogen regulation protein NR(II) [Accumulibacter sp.]MDS4056599.1 nitrogen regulation protein NR(II) [Accumulibacter sp.]HMV06187.1 nitrogen regulation protein NR(II) [Accumulibacter sp.]HMW64799.1 nitrogen regulation protein NR(II) [Accumulibacter sp.]HNC26949.1 nitrogen regulation protein NR(II) [Accumulibacter sp.]HND39953.1 nitrogen regulation protein NR(II) [Accumulibacter sp.]
MTEPAASAFGGLDLLSSAVVLLDERLAIRYLNPAAENLLGISGKVFADLPLAAFMGCPPALLGAFDKVLGQGWGYTGENIELRLADGEVLPVNCAVNPVDAADVRLLVELWPIDQQLRATREERLAEQQHANRELISNLVHEIKNPLGGIRGAAQLLEHELNNPALREYTQVIIKEADRLQDLMRRLLSPHRPMQPGPVNIHEILERVRSLLTAEFPLLRVQRDYDTSLPDLVGDREQLIQVFLNIVRNAAQAIDRQPASEAPAPGQITLRTRVARQVTLAKRRYRLAIAVEVLDNGPGIPDDIRERMFYPLVSGRPDGSGLGLTLAQSFVQQHQGTIDCSSRPGHTRFTIRLPLA